MQPLKDAIIALRKELEAAISADVGAHLKTDRVVVTLELTLLERTGNDGSPQVAIGVLDAKSIDRARREGSHGHTLVLELTPNKPELGTPIIPSAAEQAARSGQPRTLKLEGVEADRVAKSFSTVLGPPGFDSSARATVFREALAELSEPETRTVIESLVGKPPADATDAMKKARHLVSGILKSGPTRSVAGGGEILAEIFREYSIASVLRLIEYKWKTQSDWLD